MILGEYQEISVERNASTSIDEVVKFIVKNEK